MKNFRAVKAGSKHQQPCHTNKTWEKPYGPYGFRQKDNRLTKTFDILAGKNELISFHGRHGKYVPGLGLITRTKRNTKK